MGRESASSCEGKSIAGSFGPYTSKQGTLSLRTSENRLFACKPAIEAETAWRSALEASARADVPSGVRTASQSTRSFIEPVRIRALTASYSNGQLIAIIRSTLLGHCLIKEKPTNAPSP